MFAALRTIWRALYRRRQWEQDLDDELRLHLECRTRDLVNAGLAPDEALRRARLELGLERVKEECRDAHRFAPIEELWQDLRYGIRSLAGSPRFTIVAVLTLALGIGANTTIFSVINALVFRPLPLREPDQLVVINEVNVKSGGQRDPTMATFLDWKRHTRTLQNIGRTSFSSGGETLSGAGFAERVGTGICTPDFLIMTGVRPILGRALFEYSSTGTSDTAVISDALWRRKFASDPNALGRAVTLGNKSRTIIGVLPPGFSLLPFDMGIDLWYGYDPAYTPKLRWLTAVGRLKPSVTVEQAQAELNSISRGQTDADRDWSVRVEPLHESLVGGTRPLLYVLLGAVGFVLLIACVNVANLLLARAAARQKEMAIRASLGAGRFRMFRQLLVENMLLAMLGGLLGSVGAHLGTRILVAMKPFGLSESLPIHMDVRVLGFTAAVSLLTGILFGLLPALRASRPDLNETLKEGGRQSSGGLRHGGQGLLLVSEVALVLVLLVGAGLLMNSFLGLQKVELGFNPKNVLQARIFLMGPKYFQVLRDDMKRVTPQGLVFYEQVLARVEKIPGVVSASVSSTDRRMFAIVGRPVRSGRQPSAIYNEVSPGFFRNLEIPLRMGRGLTERDTESSPWVVVINEAMVRQYFPKENPIGQQVRLSMSAGGHGVDEDRPREIVGVVGDTRQFGFRSDPYPAMYGSFRQHVWLYPGGQQTSHVLKRIEVRTAGHPMNMAAALKKIAEDADKDQALYDIKSMEDALLDSVSFQRFLARLFGIFAALGLFLAAVGIYGVISYLVSRRTHEMGIRIALGASRANVLKLIIGRGLRATVIGLVIGILASLGLTRLIARLLFNVKPTDPPTYIAVALILTAVALAACYVPARRATRVDPVTALRHE